MNRRHIAFDCEGAQLIGTLDEGGEPTALLIVTGGNEVRAGAWNGQAQFAARIASAGFPVFRFDRRGVGDSEGVNTGFSDSVADISAAIAALHAAAPQVTRVVGMGNCDGATALVLAKDARCDALVLSNPWTIEGDEGDEPAPAPPAAVRAHYLRRLRDPRAILRLLRGSVKIGQLIDSLKSALQPAPPPSTLAQTFARELKAYAGPVSILLAGRDRTAQVFEASWDKSDPRVRRCAEATHSYVEAQDWLEAQVLESLRA
ncbi:hydrolase 1, exosortase A system-associated [Novosphingobium sp.]|uniref:hydrolase 1, exosortase A system-associated n=1 Tax=Novosphingobium sp. TaxID=1874826 RepID=UPI00286E389D|nr:hydrolase 1, exosortase A system-associated [Novosphingobium sp.]